jgi:hypothetical protein
VPIVGTSVGCSGGDGTLKSPLPVGAPNGFMFLLVAAVGVAPPAPTCANAIQMPAPAARADALPSRLRSALLKRRRLAVAGLIVAGAVAS